MRAALEQSINASPEHVYSSELTAKATRFIRWIKQNRHNYIDSQGLLDPQVVAFAFDGVSGVEEMDQTQTLPDRWSCVESTCERPFRVEKKQNLGATSL